MIAPLRQTDREPPTGSLQRARRAVATMLFERERDRGPAPPAWSGWKAWLFAGWIVVVLGAYAASMLGLLGP